MKMKLVTFAILCCSALPSVQAQNKVVVVPLGGDVRSNQTCPSDQVMRGIDVNGNIICESKTCPIGYTALGNSNTCFKLSDSTSTFVTANNSCFSDGGSLCNIDELTYACSNRTALGLSFEANVYLWTSSADYKYWSNDATYVGYRRYRWTNPGGCVSPYGPNPTNVNISWTSGSSLSKFACCVDKDF